MPSVALTLAYFFLSTQEQMLAQMYLGRYEKSLLDSPWRVRCFVLALTKD